MEQAILHIIHFLNQCGNFFYKKNTHMRKGGKDSNIKHTILNSNAIVYF